MALLEPLCLTLGLSEVGLYPPGSAWGILAGRSPPTPGRLILTARPDFCLSPLCPAALCVIGPGKEVDASAGASDQRPHVLVRAPPHWGPHALRAGAPLSSPQPPAQGSPPSPASEPSRGLLIPGDLQSALSAPVGNGGELGLAVPQVTCAPDTGAGSSLSPCLRHNTNRC